MFAFKKTLLVSSFSFVLIASGFIHHQELVAAGPVAALQDTEFEVGDLVELNFLGSDYEGTVTRFTGTGWPYVEFEYRGKTKEQFFPPSRLKLLESADSESGSEMPAAEIRQWVDATGKFKIKAKFLSNKNGKVELEKEDGRIITLPANKLSSTDQEYLKQLELAESDENPFAGGEKKSGSKSASSGRKSSGRASSKSGAKASNVTTLSPEYASNEIALIASDWNVKPNPSTLPATKMNKVVSIPGASDRYDFHNQFSGTQLTIGNELFGTAVGNAFRNTSEIVTIDLKTGRVKNKSTVAIKQATLLAVSPDGEKLVTVRKGKGRDKGSVDFWQAGDEPKQTLSWESASFFDRDGFAPKSGLFLDDARLMTVGNRLVVWNVESAAAIYSASIDSECATALSPGKKQVAVRSGDSVYILNVDDGTVMGELQPPEKNSTLLAFSKTGQFLAGYCSGTGAIWVWDLTANKLVRELSSNQRTASSLTWVGNQHLLVNDRSLIDVWLRSEIWKYNVTGKLVASGDGRFWVANKTRFAPVQLPPGNLGGLSKYDPDELLVLKPGSRIKLDFKLPFPPAEQKKIRDEVTSRLEANNMTLDQSADLVLKATVEKRKSESTEVSDFMGGPFGRRGSEKITYTPTYASLQLLKNGKPVWSSGRLFSLQGMVIHMKNGESAQQAANRMCKPSPAFFSQTRFPKYFAQLPDGKVLGETTFGK
jgi:WD40 repeat protein